MMAISPALLTFTWTLLATGVLSASFENLRPFFSDSGLGKGDAHVHGKRTRSVDSTVPVQLCGFRLLQTVRGLCGSSTHERRSDPGFTLNGMLEELTIPSNSLYPGDGSAQYANDGESDPSADYQQEQDWNRSPKMLALKVLAEGKGHQRYRRNIIDECCKRPCTFNHMLKYCGRT